MLACRPHRTSVLAALVGATLLGAVLLPFPALAQADSTHAGEPTANDGPTRYEDIGWYKMTLIQFQAGKSREALSVIGKYWPRAVGQADAPVPALVEIPKGPWDVMMIFPLEKRPLELKWQSPAELEELRAAFQAVLDEEEATKAWRECKSLIEGSTSLVGFSGRHGLTMTERLSPPN